MAYEHNVVNGALAVVAAEEVLGRPVTPDEADAAGETFEGLPHRLQTVRTTGRTRGSTTPWPRRGRASSPRSRRCGPTSTSR